MYFVVVVAVMLQKDGFTLSVFCLKAKDNSRACEILVSLFPPLVASPLAGNFQMRSCNSLALLCLIIIFESEDETSKCDSSCETSLMILSQWFTLFLEMKFRISQRTKGKRKTIKKVNKHKQITIN